MRVRKIYPPPPHPKDRNVFEYISSVLIRFAPFEASCGTARGFLGNCMAARNNAAKFQLNVFNIDPTSVSDSKLVDKKASMIEVKLNDGSTHTFGASAKSVLDVERQLKDYASLNEVEAK